MLTETTASRLSKQDITMDPLFVENIQCQRISLRLTDATDVFFEVLRLLDPADLLALTRTSKTLRSALLSKSSLSVWKSVLKNNSTTPECPQDVPEPAWVNLLFGSECQVCGVKKVQYWEVCFALRRRACKSCLNGREFHVRDENSPNISNIPWNLIRSSSSYGWPPHYYLKSEVEEMERQVALSRWQIHQGGSEAANALRAWNTMEAERMDFVNLMKNHETLCRNWMSVASKTASQEQRMKICNAAKERFVNIGYHPEDCQQMYYMYSHLVESSGVSDENLRNWEVVRPIFEPLVKETREKRLERGSVVQTACVIHDRSLDVAAISV